MVTRQEKNKEIQDKIIWEEKKTRFKKISKISTIILVIIFSIIIYGLFIGSKIIINKEFKITDKNIPSSFHGFKIVQISDLLYNSLNKNDLKKLTNQINELDADIIIFNGDIKKRDYKLKKNDISYLTSFFNSLNAKIEKYAVIGDNDDESFYVIMENSNFKILNNKSEKLYYKNSTPLEFIGFNTNDLNTSDSENDYYKICLLHNPDYIDNILEKVNCNLALAGDTLGGQIKILNAPLFDAHKYSGDYYKINDTSLYISNGLGNTINVRYFNHPSINLFRITTY